MNKYYALKVEEEIVFVIPWDKQQDPTLSDFQFAIAKVWGKLGSDFQNKAVSDYNISGIERVGVTSASLYPDTSKDSGTNGTV